MQGTAWVARADSFVAEDVSAVEALDFVVSWRLVNILFWAKIEIALMVLAIFWNNTYMYNDSIPIYIYDEAYVFYVNLCRFYINSARVCVQISKV